MIRTPSVRRRPLQAALATAALLACHAAVAQQPPPASATALPPPGAAAAANDVVQLSGTVARLLVNPSGEVDGLLLRDGTQIGTAPHLSADLVAAVKAGDAVRISGWRTAGVPVVHAVTLTNGSSGKAVVDRPPEAPRGLPGPPGAAPAGPSRNAAPLAAMQAGGKVDRLLYGARGEANGVLLGDGTVVRVAPHAVAQFVDLMRPGATLQAQGYGVSTAYGKAVEAAYVGADASSLRAVFPPRPGAAPGAGPERGRPGPRGPAGDVPGPRPDAAPPAPPAVPTTPAAS